MLHKIEQRRSLSTAASSPITLTQALPLPPAPGARHRRGATCGGGRVLSAVPKATNPRRLGPQGSPHPTPHLELHFSAPRDRDRGYFSEKRARTCLGEEGVRPPRARFSSVPGRRPTAPKSWAPLSDESVVRELIRCLVALESYRLRDMLKKDQAGGRRELGISASSPDLPGGEKGGGRVHGHRPSWNLHKNSSRRGVWRASGSGAHSSEGGLARPGPLPHTRPLSHTRRPPRTWPLLSAASLKTALRVLWVALANFQTQAGVVGTPEL